MSAPDFVSFFWQRRTASGRRYWVAKLDSRALASLAAAAESGSVSIELREQPPGDRSGATFRLVAIPDALASASPTVRRARAPRPSVALRAGGRGLIPTREDAAQ